MSVFTLLLRNYKLYTMYKYKEYLHPWIWISSVVWRTTFIFVFWTATLGHFHEYFLWKQAKHREEVRSLALETLLSTLGCCRQSSQQLFGYLRHENQLFCSSSVPGTTLLDWGHVYIYRIVQFSSVHMVWKATAPEHEQVVHTHRKTWLTENLAEKI